MKTHSRPTRGQTQGTYTLSHGFLPPLTGQAASDPFCGIRRDSWEETSSPSVLKSWPSPRGAQGKGQTQQRMVNSAVR